MKTKSLIISLLVVFLSSSGINAQSIVKTSDEIPNYAEVLARSLPNVTNIRGLEDAPINIQQSYYAQVDGTVPSDCFYNWLVFPSDDAVIAYQSGSTVSVIFKKSGTYQITCRIQSRSGEVGLSRYMIVNAR